MSKPRKAPEKKVKVTLYTPHYFGSRELGVTLVKEPSEAVNRVVRTSLYALTDDVTKQFLIIKFKVIRVNDSVGETIFYGHEYGREYLRSLVKRGSTKIDYIFDVKTKDGYELRLECSAFAYGLVRSGKKKAIRKIMKQVAEEAASNLDFGQFAQEVVLGKTASDMYNLAKRICLLRHIGVIKTKVLRVPEEVFKEPAKTTAPRQPQ